MIKSKRNYSFKKATKLITNIIADTLSQMAVYQNESIQRGLSSSVDINGKSFEKLKQSTLDIRNKRGQGFTPLDRMKGERQKKLRNTKVIPAKPSKLVSQVKMQTDYGVYHNEGFKTGSNSMIPDKKVPKREWFGITKDMRKNGAQYEKYVRMSLRRIVKSVNI